ncbi:IS1634 family transposase [Parafrankia colletiae]|uniref:IS1634 family transposase n=1 Tax=Parafrankia colletiae TaxID=573497 RepID=UPI000A4F773D|nr:IS1634 family transposase [Parafrankia colletiae]
MLATADLLYGPPSSEKFLGSLPVIRSLLARIDLVAIIDRLCPIQENKARYTHGQVIAMLIANRLTSPTPLIRVEQWARRWAVKEIFGIEPDALNDDRCGRALEALAEQADAIVGSIGAAAVTAFGIETLRFHWDMTSMSVYGAYDQADPAYATPKPGHPKDHRFDLKQVQVGVATSADGAVALLTRAYDGGAAEISQVEGALRALRELAGERRFLMVGDSKLVSYTNLRAIDAAGATFVAPASRTLVGLAELAAHDPTTATIVDWAAQRDQDKLFHERDVHRVVEGTTTLRGPKAADPPFPVRTVFSHSARRAETSATTRTKQIDKARAALVVLHRNLGTRYYPDEAAVRARVEKITAECRVGAWLRTHVDTDPDAGRPHLTWFFDPDALDLAKKADGWFALLTNQSIEEKDAAGVFLDYKGQEASERRYSAFKGPLAVDPLYVENNQRIHGLLHVVGLALLLFSLIERQARQTAGPSGKVPGLYAGRPARPTGRLLLEALADLRLVPARDGQPAYIPRPTPLQQRVLDLLGVDPTRPP